MVSYPPPKDRLVVLRLLQHPSQEQSYFSALLIRALATVQRKLEFQKVIEHLKGCNHVATRFILTCFFAARLNLTCFFEEAEQ